METPDLIELQCEIATEMMDAFLDGVGEKSLWKYLKSEDGEETYTEDGQEIFNSYYERAEYFVYRNGLERKN